MSDPEYCYPPSYEVLRNRLGIRDSGQLDYFEREIVAQRTAQGVPSGNFDLKHLQSIHRHLFQDVYDWAGMLRTVEISKDGRQFQFRQYIGVGMADIHRRLIAMSFLTGLDDPAFAEEASKIIGDVNYVHPFRDGNGRTQLLYLEQLCMRAGHSIDLRRLDPQQWLEASRRSYAGDYALMTQCISGAIRL